MPALVAEAEHAVRNTRDSATSDSVEDYRIEPVRVVQFGPGAPYRVPAGQIAQYEIRPGVDERFQTG